ncbi:MAG: ferrous iron transport protein B [Planctomycetia bacterium]|nr:ferrous iron transport protein B [Planctomycetia bacterium]
MPTTAAITVALIGNPNTGKSTLFNALAGVRQRVGNYPGVTVERKTGQLNHAGRHFTLVDLPGTYSLAPRSPDEMVAVDVLLGRRADTPAPDAILCIVDASNLERNLYLVSQALELGLPTVVALNMTDVAATRGISIDHQELARRLGIPVVPVQANRRRGLKELANALAAAVEQPRAERESPFPKAFQREVAQLSERLERDAPTPRYLVERLLLDTSDYLEGVLGGDQHAALTQSLVDARARLAAAGFPVPAVEAIARYGWVGRIIDGVVARPSRRPATRSDAIDRMLTHKVWGTLVFALAMMLLFSSIFVWADPLMGMIEDGQGWLQGLVGSRMAAGPLQSLVVDGIIGGVGSVVVFLPQIFILFGLIAILEDCGYMARAAYLMDKLMSRVGLSGKSFIPLLSSFACAVPGIMATRVIENRRDRLTTILVAPLMSCSARLPVYTLLCGMLPAKTYLFGTLSLGGLTMFAMYLLGIVAAMLVALVLKRSLLRGATPPFVMELPSYKFPSITGVLYRMLERGWAFIQRAGTVIFAVSVLVWAASYFPRDEAAVEGPYAAERERLETVVETGADDDKTVAEERLAEIDHEVASLYQQRSWLGQAGKWIEPAVRPLGWDWRIGAAAIASFPAREVIIGVLGVIYNVGDEPEETSLRERLSRARWDGTDRPIYTVPVALSIMVFFALCAQCAATLAVIKRETNSWGWPAFTFGYMTALAYVGALLTYQVGTWLGF